MPFENVVNVSFFADSDFIFRKQVNSLENFYKHWRQDPVSGAEFFFLNLPFLCGYLNFILIQLTSSKLEKLQDKLRMVQQHSLPPQL